MIAAPLAADLRLTLGESPCWDPATQSLLAVDMDNGSVHRIDVHRIGPPAEFATFRPHPAASAVQVVRDGSLMVLTPDGLVRQSSPHLDEWQTTPIAALTSPGAATRTNDAACDARGRLWCGTYEVGFPAGSSKLLRLDAPHTATAVLTGLELVNGLAWSPDGAVMYIVDSRARTVHGFTYDLASGLLTDRRTIVTIAPEHGFPDGLAVAADGGLWVALYLGSAVHHYSPEGRLLDVITLPVAKVTSVCFGGSTLMDLFVTTASSGLTSDDLARQPSAGAIFVVPGVGPGLPATPFDPSTLTAKTADHV